jgi:hypothetical protein
VIGRGDYSRAGLAVTRELLDLPCLGPGKVYVWGSTLSAKDDEVLGLADRVIEQAATENRFFRFKRKV